ncbi:MAG: MFS transporter [Myxococcales bacterium]|nr:MFS transporter [Myxococcales bacterium]
MPSLLRRNPSFRRLWAAGAVSLVGDWLSLVAVATLATTSGGGALGRALVFAAHALPAALFAPFAGVIVDSFDRRRVLIVADAGAAIVTVGMVACALAGAPLAIPLLVLVRSAITSIVPPGESAAVRVLVAEGDLLPANAILAATWSVAFVVGMALGGLAAMLGPALALALDAGSFVLAAILHASLPALPVTAPPRSLGAVVRATPRDTVHALRVAARTPRLLAAMLGKSPLGLAGGAGWIALNLLAAEAQPFGPTALSFGLLQAIRGAGTGIGPAIASRLRGRGVSDVRLQAYAVTAALVAITGLAVTRSPIALALAALVWGVGTGANWVLAHTSLQQHAGEDVIGRLAAFDELLVTSAMVFSAFVGAVVFDAGGLAAVPLLGSALGLVGVVAVGLAILLSRRASLARSR